MGATWDGFKAAWRGVKALSRLDEVLTALGNAHELHGRNEALEVENRELRKKLEFHGTLTFRDNMYWSGSDKDPRCPGCWDDRHKAIRLVQKTVGSEYHCPICKGVFNSKPPKPYSPSAHVATGRRERPFPDEF